MKGQSLIWIVYIMITAAVIAAVQFLPNNILSGSVDTHELEFGLYSDRFFSVLSYRDPVTMRKYVGVVDRRDISESKINVSYNRPFGGVVVVDDVRLFVNKDYYNDFKILSGSRYKNIMKDRLVVVPEENRASVLKTDFVFGVEE